jgi:hypothetical protein
MKIGDFRVLQDGDYNLVVHVYDYSKKFLNSVVQACPPLFSTNDPYVNWNASKID